MLEVDDFLKEVDRVVEILKKNDVDEIEVSYGWSWGDWEPFNTTIAELNNDIRRQEIKTGDKFGDNDVYICIYQHDIEILFCHEADIHMEFNLASHVVTEILNSWNDNQYIHCIRKNNAEIGWAELVTDNEAGFV